MRHLLILITSLTAATATCTSDLCDTAGFVIKTRHLEDPLDSEPVIKNKIMASSRFWGKRAFPDELRRASIRWGKRWDAKAWRQMYAELLRPTNIATKWTPIVKTQHVPDVSAQMQEDDEPVLRVAKAANIRPKLALSSRLWGR
ncbi:hypothetical protein NECAME_00169 [Necator americanus]|uniref:Uncharacterized protein n=1 Tax=Necator americanus TaxID=51031 RepID=W2TZ26_NECAM|nr:hypothetical protein NECAME_00169 [Necator americanus]ETN87310.1 hypothetical protein NECAME_00169 [Necator americanus]